MKSVLTKAGFVVFALLLCMPGTGCASSENVCQNVTAKASSIYQNDITGHSPKLLFDGRHDLGWGTAESETTGWVEFDLEKAAKVRRVVIDEGYLNRVRGYVFKAKLSDGSWKELVRGDRLGYMCELEFPAVTAKTFRLEITKTVTTAGLWEIQLYSTPAPKFDNPREMAPKNSLEKYHDLKLGAWIILGPYSIAAQELSWCREYTVPRDEYDQLYKKFDPANFDPEGYMRILKKAGFKYVMFVPKHHDGFCLWDTKTTDYNVMNTPFQRDMTKELVAAAKKVGISFNLYYSVADWYNPDYVPHGYRPFKGDFGGPLGILPEGEKPDFDRYIDYMKVQLKELSDIAGPTLMWWFDGSWSPNYTPERARDVYMYLRELQPKGLFSNRIGCAFYRNTYAPTWYASEKESFGDYVSTEVQMAPFTRDIPWEFTQPSLNGYSWTNSPIKPGLTYVKWIIESAIRDGNQLIATAIKGDGTFDPRLIEQLKVMEDWTTRFGESYYGTRGGPYKNTTWYGSTCRDNNVYVHVFKTDNGKLVLPALGKKITSARLLGRGVSDEVLVVSEQDLKKSAKTDGAFWGGPEESDQQSKDDVQKPAPASEQQEKEIGVAQVDVEQTDENVIIKLDPKDVVPFYTIVHLEIEGDAVAIEPIEETPVNEGVSAKASSTADGAHAAVNTCDGKIATCWKANPEDRQAWIEYDLGAEQTVSRAILSEGMEESQPISISAYQIQAKIDGEWKNVYNSAPIWAGHPWSIAVTNQEPTFPTAKSRYFRLNISAARDDIIVHEFKLYER